MIVTIDQVCPQAADCSEANKLKKVEAENRLKRLEEQKEALGE
jgi:hypothetical protein